MLTTFQLGQISEFACQNTSLFVVAGLGALLLLWRLWRFTVIPAWWPKEPRLLPYWIPGIGHTREFMNNVEKLFNKGYDHFGSNEPFALTVGGRRIVVLRNVQDVATLWRNTNALEYDPFTKAVIESFGVRPDSIRKIYTKPPPVINGSAQQKSLLINDNPHEKSYMHLQSDWFKVQLLSRENLMGLLETYQVYLDSHLRWEQLSPSYILSSDPAGSCKTISLQAFGRYSVSDSAIRTFFGPRLLQIAPTFLQHYQKFEDDSWKIFYHYPRFLARDLHVAKEKAVDGLVEYLSLPEKERPDLTWIFRTMNSELQYMMVPPHDIARIIMLISWAINNNAHKIAFWIFAHILHDPAYFASLRSEVDRAFSVAGAVDTNVLLTQCPHLDAVWHETLRFYNNASAVRSASAPCTIGGKDIHVGDTVIGPFRQFHLHRGIFGEDALTFEPRRFLEKPNLQRVKGYAPFGGGQTYCPGRLFARSEIYLFVAFTLYRFELSLHPREEKLGVPKVTRDVPEPAAMAPDRDILVMLSPRTHKT